MLTCEMSKDDFETIYSSPIIIDGQDIRGVSDIYSLYREKMLECRNVTQMRDLADQFGFLAEDAREVLDHVQTWQLPTIKKYWAENAVLDQEEEELFAPLILPITMLYGKLIAEEYAISEYSAAFKYVYAVMYTNLH